MDTRDDEFLKRIKETFRIEAEEHLNAFTAGLIDLEKKQSQEKYTVIIETMFRDIHSLKGAARSVDQREIESICQPLESVFSALKRKEITLSPASFDLFYKTAENLSKLTKGSGSALTAADREFHRELIQKLNEIATGTVKTTDIAEPKQIKERKPVVLKPVTPTGDITGSDNRNSVRSISSETVRIQISKLDPLLLQAEELLQSKKAINQRINELQEINTCVNECKAQSLKWKGHRLTGSSAFWNEWSESNDSGLNKLANRLTELTASMERDQYSIDTMVDIHLEAMRQVLMLPISWVVAVFPKMVREISRVQKKEIEFIIRGEDLEIDKRILEELKDPLIHLIRNSIDHGIDKPQMRILQNKPARGTIILSFAARENGLIEITLSDDGKGINKENVFKAAIKSGILSAEAAGKINPEEILSLIFQSGVSTSSFITDLSGRGLGLSIVHEKVEKLNGKISVETVTNIGTTFHILIPMTLATFRGVLVKMKEFMFILPLMNVERVIMVEPDAIKTVKNHETILFDNRILSVVDLGEVLGLPDHKHEGSGEIEPRSAISNKVRLVVLVSGESRIAFKVDEVIDEQQVLVKGNGKLLRRVNYISGSTILGSGKVVPVLHIPDLFKSALRSAEKIKEHISQEKVTGKIKKILVADDSITSRTLIKNILETSGYQVFTAVDGTDAFTMARTNEFDLIVSDVDMPRMNGFELIAKIRHDKKLSEVPVVLVTSLGSQEDHERGIEVGADAYIIKSSFDQNNLLEIIKKLI